ncbi:hypothetical protein V2E24_03010 [Mycoplasmopsis ciconiae]|uniref:Uncharacterized protein n=1 Tax=Mycoplasmopsis ciconiae TaxID=561067 RepID=A0ABU7MM67_9BACT|nr:hypothetical protein [Mycoplasmopsis ciconiae]
MDKIIEALVKKIKQDEKRLKRVQIFDRLLSLIITLLNLTVVAIAVTTLVILVRLLEDKKDQNISKSSFYLLIVLVSFILSNFFLTIFIEVYKKNMRDVKYKKIQNTLLDLYIKYQSNVITEEELDQYINILYTKLKRKSKIVVADIVKEQLQKGK